MRAVGARGGLQGVDRRFADTAWGNVQHAQERDVVFGMHGQAHVGERVFYFGAIVKAKTPDEFVAQAAAAEGFFKSTRLKIGSIFDRAGLRGIVIENALKFASNEFSFGLGVAAFKIFQVAARTIFGI